MTLNGLKVRTRIFAGGFDRTRLKGMAACLLAALLAAALAGCAAVLEFLGLSKKEDPNSYPAAYRSAVLEYVRRNPTDIAGVGEASISTPSMKPFDTESRYFVCVKTGEKGSQIEKIAVFAAGKIIQFVDAPEQCKGAFYQPFPEIVAISQQPSGKK